MKILLKYIPFLVFPLFLFSCSLFENDNPPNQSGIDYLIGTEESGRLKKQLNYSSSEDETLNSEVEYFYNSQNQLTKEELRFFTDESQSYVHSRTEYTYGNGKLAEKKYFARNYTTDPMKLLYVYEFRYPDINTKMELFYNRGELKDSIIYRFKNNLLVNEKHFPAAHSEWEIKYSYTSGGKLKERTELPLNEITINHFDENGLLEKTVGLVENDVRTTITYEREDNGSQLIIRSYINDIYSNRLEPIPHTYKIFENSKLVEYVKYHPTFPGSEWFCQRYEYY